MTSFRADISQTVSAGYAAFGRAWSLRGHNIPGVPADREHSVAFWKLADELLAQEKIAPHPVRVMPDGLVGVAAGLKMQKEGKVSAEKLVYLIGTFLLVLRVGVGVWMCANWCVCVDDTPGIGA